VLSGLAVVDGLKVVDAGTLGDGPVRLGDAVGSAAADEGEGSEPDERYAQPLIDETQIDAATAVLISLSALTGSA
jgi:hypothetical protein